MGLHRDVYEFAARAGAFEGYVYGKEKIDPNSLRAWVSNLVRLYHHLPSETRVEFQDLCDGTLGRAIRSLMRSLGERHELVEALKGLTQGRLPASPDDFSNSK